MTGKPACGSCRYFHPGLTTVAGTAVGAGECRQAPPSIETTGSLVTGYGWRLWPAVWANDDWCGHFLPKDFE